MKLAALAILVAAAGFQRVTVGRALREGGVMALLCLIGQHVHVRASIRVGVPVK